MDDFLLSLVHHTLVVYPLYPIPYPIFNRYFFNRYLPAFREDKRSFGNTSLANVPLNLVGLGDRPLIDVGGELGVHVPALTEGLHEVVLSSKIGHKPGLDLTGVTGHDHMPIGRSQRLAQRTPSRQVLEVDLVPTTEAAGVRAIVVEHDGQRPPLGDLQKPLCACLLDGALGPKPGLDHGPHCRLGMVEQGQELSVVLGEGIGLLARGRAGLHRWLCAQRL
jgi:hypothetical protein